MKNECLRFIEDDSPVKSLNESQEMYEVSHVVNREIVTEVLPKEKAETLLRKLRGVTDTAFIKEVKQTQVPASERW